MKTIYTLFLAILGLFLGNLLVYGQTADSVIDVEINTETTGAEVEAVSVTRVQSDGTTDQTTTIDIEMISMDISETGDETPGTELDDIGAPTAVDPTGIEHEDIGVTDHDESAPGIESDEIDAPAPAAFGVEREMKESGEKGGTEDINIGIGELQETTDADHKDWIIIESISSPMNKAELLDEIAHNSGGGLRSGYLKIDDIKGESTESDGVEPDEIDAPAPESSAKKPKEIVVVGSKVRGDNVPQLIRDTGEESAAPDSFFDIWIDLGEDRNTAPDSFFDIFTDLGEDRNAAPDSFFDIFVDVSEEDLHLQAVSIAQTDENVEEVKVLEDRVRVDLKEEVRLFGIIPIRTTKTIVVDTTDPGSDSRVKVQFPWWHVFTTGGGDPEALAEEIEAELDDTIPTADTDDRPTEEVAFYYNKIQAQTLQTISNVSK